MFPFSLAGLAATGRAVERGYDELPFQPDRPGSVLERRYANGASSFLDTGNARLHYRDEGTTAPTLLALHGAYSSLHTWNDWVEELAADVRFVRLDMPGFGLTGPLGDGPHTLTSLVENVARFCDELGLSAVTVAGNSLGGAVAWRLAIERPDLVSGLVLVDAGGEKILANVADRFTRPPKNVVPRYFTPRATTRLILEDAYGDTDLVTEELVSRYHDLIVRTGNRRAILELAREWEGDEYDPADINVPALVQWGTADEWIPPAMGRDLAEAIPDGRFERYEDVGHVAMEEAPVDTAADARSFLL